MKNIESIKTHHLNNILGFELDSIDHVNDYNPIDRHRHNYWEIFIFDEGEGTHQIDFDEFHFRSKSIHIIQPNQIHTLKRNPRSNGLVILFDEQYLQTSQANKQLLLKLLALKLRKLSPIIQLEDTEFGHLWDILKILKNDMQKHDIFTKTKISNFLNIIFCQCAMYLGESNNEAKSPYLDTYYTFIELVMKNDNLHKSIEDYAKILSCSTKQLRNACVHCSGLTPIEILHEQILHRAKELLLYEAKSIKDVAYQLNFSDISHFTNFFKNKTGILPSKFITS